MNTVKTALVFCVMALYVGVGLICYGIRDLWLLCSRRRCHVSAADADWLADALGDHECPWCDRELTSH